jgi:hypothetical protein
MIKTTCINSLQGDHAKLLEKKVEKDRAVQQLQQRMAVLESSTGSTNSSQAGASDPNVAAGRKLPADQTSGGVSEAGLGAPAGTQAGGCQTGGPRGLGTSLRGSSNAKGRSSKSSSGMGEAVLLEALQQEKSARLAAEAQVSLISSRAGHFL